MNKIWIYLENGVFLEANSFGVCGTSVGEIVFNTSMTGYQEVITDPSYAGQFITFTMPEIGIVGVNENDMESNTVYAKGVIVHSYNNQYSNYRGQNSLDTLLKKHNILGICNIDTRGLTQIVRDQGSMMMIASTKISNKEDLKKELEKNDRIEDINYIKQVSTKESYIHKLGAWNHTIDNYNEAIMCDKKIVVIDFGVKKNILNELVEVGLEVEVIPASFEANDLIKRFKNKEIGGIFLSNGPGDPLTLEKNIIQIRKLIDKDIPMFGICLGHQLLSIAHGYNTYKLKFGQHGVNHPVGNENNIVEITSQNHNYNVPSTIEKIAHITHRNLFDDTIEGVKYKDKDIFSVQHHPEGSPGPHESKYIFKEFANIIK